MCHIALTFSQKIRGNINTKEIVIDWIQVILIFPLTQVCHHVIKEIKLKVLSVNKNMSIYMHIIVCCNHLIV